MNETRSNLEPVVNPWIGIGIGIEVSLDVNFDESFNTGMVPDVKARLLTR